MGKNYAEGKVGQGRAGEGRGGEGRAGWGRGGERRAGEGRGEKGRGGEGRGRSAACALPIEDHRIRFQHPGRCSAPDPRSANEWEHQ